MTKARKALNFLKPPLMPSCLTLIDCEWVSYLLDLKVFTVPW